MSMTKKVKEVEAATRAAPDELVTEQGLLRRAEAAAAKAYAPYSHLRIGAALLTSAGHIFEGCNVENASYSLTWCAERTAVVTAVAAEGGSEMHVRMIAIWTDDFDHCPPCGACRQVLAEFGPEAIVIYPSVNGLTRCRVSDLLPDQFLTP